VVENLLRDSWADLEQGELRVVLKEHITGGLGQYDGGLDVFYLPLAREQCRVALEHFPKRMTRAGFPCRPESDSRIVLEGRPV
jgi:hypothetical protein